MFGFYALKFGLKLLLGGVLLASWLTIGLVLCLYCLNPRCGFGSAGLACVKVVVWFPGWFLSAVV